MTISEIEKWAWINKVSVEIATVMYVLSASERPIDAIWSRPTVSEISRITKIAFRHSSKNTMRWGAITFHRPADIPPRALKYENLTE